MTTSVDLLEVHQAVCDRLIAAGINRSYPSIRDNFEPPCIVVIGSPDGYVTLDQAFRNGLVGVTVTILMLGPADTQRGQEQVMRWLSVGDPESVIDALNADRTLGGIVTSLQYGANRYAAAVEWPQGSGNRYVAGEQDITLVIGAT